MAYEMPPEWKRCFDEYQALTGFEPMHLDEIADGSMSIKDAWHSNIKWLEDVHAEVMNINPPYDYDEE